MPSRLIQRFFNVGRPSNVSQITYLSNLNFINVRLDQSHTHTNTPTQTNTHTNTPKHTQTHLHIHRNSHTNTLHLKAKELHDCL